MKDIKNKFRKIILILKLNRKSSKKLLFSYFLLGFFTEIITITKVFIPAILVQFLINKQKQELMMIILLLISFLVSISNFIVTNLQLKITRNSKYLDNKIYCILNKKNAYLDYEKCFDNKIENLYFNAFDNIYHWQDIPILLLNYIISRTITFIIMFIVFCKINFWLVIFVFSTIIIDYIICKKEQKIKKKHNDDFSKYTYKERYLLDCLANYKLGKELRIFDSKHIILQKYNQIANATLEIEKKINKNHLIFSIISKLINFLRLFIIFLFAIFNFKNGYILLGEFLVYISAITQMSDSFGDIIDCIMMINNALFYFDDFEEYLNIDNLLRKPANCVGKMNKKTPLLEFDNVSFKYPNTDEYVLKNISFKIYKNQVTSIVGDNGAGKSTLIKLILRLYDSDKGNIYYNGKNIKNYNYDLYQSFFSVTFQDYKMYCYSIKENIMFDNEINEKKLDSVLKCLNIDELIKEIGINTNYSKRFDENGIELSGGEQQKIAIARALYKNSEVFIFDEPTATIDPLSEYSVYKNIYQLAKENKTVIFISHRMGSTFYSDNTIVLDNGMTIENDNYKNLLKKEGIYKKMYSCQSKYYK